MSEVGYKKPPVETQFGAGNKANPIGKTSAQRKAEIDNAEKATLVRGRLLDAVIVATEAGDESSLAFIEAGVLKLLKDAEDRGLGTAVQSLNVESPNGTMTPAKQQRDFSNLSNEELAQLELLTDKTRDTAGMGEAD